MGREEVKETLLKKDYYENCPGCKVDQRNAIQRGLPIKELFAIWTVNLCSSLSVTSLVPFLYFMVRDFNIAEKEEDTISYYAGSSFMLGRTLTSVFWGIVADRYGRKPVIIIGISAIVVFNTLFGLSINLWMAVSMRFLLGILSTIVGPIKAYATELLSEEYQALGLSAIGTAAGMGLMIGPALAGFLAQPAGKFPEVFSQESIFGSCPYFLPCLVISLFALLVNIACFWLPETLHRHDLHNPKSGNSIETLESASFGSNCEEDTCERPKSNSTGSLFKNRALMSSILVYCIFSLHDMAYSEVFSLWAVSPRRVGGLNYSTEGVGEILAISGFGLLVFQIFLFPFLVKRFGALIVIRVGGVASIPLLTSFSFMAMLSGITLTLLLNCASIVKNVLSVSILTSTIMMQNRAVVDQHRRGAANGIAATAMSLCRAVGPAGGGALLSWAQGHQDAAFLPGTHMVFFILNVIDAIAVALTFKPFLCSSPAVKVIYS